MSTLDKNMAQFGRTSNTSVLQIGHAIINDTCGDKERPEWFYNLEFSMWISGYEVNL
jgi:hypothetical protein